MTEETRPPTAGSVISDEELRSYLLCRLDDNRRSEIDQLLLADNRVAERVEVAESQLIDDYVTGDLGSGDRELFSRSFLTTDDRRQELRLSSALHEYAGASTRGNVAEQARASWFAGLSQLFSSQPALGWAAAGSFAVLLLVIGLTWLLSTRNSRPGPPLVKQEPPPAISPPPDSTPAEIARASQPSPSVESKQTPESVAPVAVVTAVLVSGTLRSEGEMTRVAVPRGERDLVRLTLTLESPSPGPYQVELLTAGGQTVAVRNNLKAQANQTIVILEVPARLIHGGDYQVKLSRRIDGQTESVGRYYFRAAPE